ncbi:MAG: hypothetical protein V6Z89_17130 [Desulfobacter sp.]
MKIIVYGFLAILLMGVGTGHAENLVLTGNLTTGNHYIHGSITTQGSTVVGAGVDVDLVALTQVALKPGFRVVRGGIFRAAASPDTDGDLIHDIVENRSGCQNFQLADTDGDGLADNEEDTNRNGIHELALNETNACNPDTDGDGIDDKWEKDNGLDPFTDDASQDPDGDNLSNYLEYKLGGSDPNDAASLPPKGAHYEYDELGRIKRIIRIK